MLEKLYGEIGNRGQKPFIMGKRPDQKPSARARKKDTTIGNRESTIEIDEKRKLIFKPWGR